MGNKIRVKWIKKVQDEDEYIRVLKYGDFTIMFKDKVVLIEVLYYPDLIRIVEATHVNKITENDLIHIKIEAIKVITEVASSFWDSEKLEEVYEAMMTGINKINSIEVKE